MGRTQKQQLSALLQAQLVEAAAQPARPSPQQALAPPETCLEGLPQRALLSICQTAAAGHMPLTAWLMLQRLQQQGLKLDSMQWRNLVSGMVAVACHSFNCTLL